MKRELRSVALLVALSCACTPDDAQVTTPDAAATEAAVVDTAIDSAPADVTADAPRPDAAPLDVAATDSTALDTAPIDAAPADTFATDVTRDARPLDAAPADIPSIDATADVRTDISAPTDTAPVDVARPDAAPAPPTFTTVFSTRSATNLPDGAIEDAIVDLINRAIPGSRVRVAVYTFTRNRVMTALVNAHRRGVDVKVVVDGGASSTPGSEVPSLMSGLGPTNVTVCRAPGTACLGTGIMHHKSYLFSALDDGSRDVVMQASHNLTNAQLSLHNNAVIVRGDAALFRAYERTFDDLRRDTAMPDYYRIDDGDLATRAYFFPRASGDTVVSIIDNATCDATSRILVAMAFFTDARIEVARSLAARRRAGCAVTVVAGDDEIPLGATVASTLTAAGVTLVRYPGRTNGWGLHSKYVLIDAPYAGSAAHRRLVFTGSHNWTGPSLDRNDETLLRVENDAVFEAFVADHARVRAAAARP